LLVFLLHDAMLARCMLSSLCPSITSWHCTKTAKCRIMQSALYNSPRTLFCYAKDLGELAVGSPTTGSPNRGGLGNLGYNWQFLTLSNGAISGDLE